MTDSEQPNIPGIHHSTAIRDAMARNGGRRSVRALVRMGRGRVALAHGRREIRAVATK